jgi:ferredoxin
MAQSNREWEALGRNIEDIVDRAVTSHDFQKLNQTIRQAVDVGADAVRKAVDTAQKKAVPHPGEAKQGQVLTAQQVEALYGNTNGKTAKGILKIVGGGLLTAASLVLLLSSLVFDALVSGAVSLTVPIVMALASGSCGGLLIGDGVGNLNRIGRFKKYKKLLGQKTYCALEKLARTVGKTEKFVRKELENLGFDDTKIRQERNSVGDRKVSEIRTFRLTVHIRDTVYELDAANNETLITALERAGIPAVVRCRNGACGFCHSRVVNGEYFIDSKDDFRRSADKKFNYIHPCSTYPESDMEIDIPIMNP